MSRTKITRREMLRGLGVAAVGAALSACQPQVIKETVVVEKVVTATPEPAPSGPIEIVFWDNAPNSEKTWGEAFPIFEAENPGIKPKLVVIPGTDWQQALFASYTVGTPPDVLEMNSNPMIELQVKYQPWLPVGELSKDWDVLDMMSPAALESLTFDNQLIGWPSTNSFMILFVRKSWMENVGWDKPAPYFEDWTEWADLMKKLTFEDPDGNGADDTWGYVMFGSMDRTYAATQFRYMMAAAGKEYILPGKLNFNTERGVEVLKFMQDCVHTWKVSPTDTSSYGHMELYRDVDAGVAGMGRCGTWNPTSWSETLNHDFVTTPYPPFKKGETAYQIGDFASLCIGKETKYPEASGKLAKFALSKPAQEIKFKQSGQNPVRNDIDLVSLGAVQEHADIMALQSEMNFHYFERDPNWGADHKEILCRHVQACLLDATADPAAELAAAEEEILPLFPS